MVRMRIFSVLTATFLMCCCAMAQNKAVEGIKANFKKQEMCWNNSDLVCYMQAYATTEEIQTISRAGVTKGYDVILKQYQQYFPPERMGKLHFDHMQFRKIGAKYYYVIGRFNLTFAEQEEVRQGYFSVLMKKIKGKWFIVSDHSS